MNAPLRVTELEQTCSACPSQWEGTRADGQPIYVRYRWGWLTVRDVPGGDVLFDKQVGDALHGVMSYEELKRHTEGVIDFP